MRINGVLNYDAELYDSTQTAIATVESGHILENHFEESVPTGAILLEDGSGFLLEDGTAALLDDG